MSEVNRRKLLAALGAGMATAAVPVATFASHKRDGSRSMTFGSGSGQIFDPRNFGARGDGKALDSNAINVAIDACTRAGGGIVYLSPGIYRSGTVTLKSNVTLYIEAGATILGSTDINDYTPQPKPGPTAQYSLIFAKDAENATLCGPGLIDGQGSSYWKRSSHVPLPPAEAWRDVNSWNWVQNGPRPGPMLEFIRCKWLRIEDVRIENAASWTTHADNCEQVFIRGISIQNPNYGPNTDGIDIVRCKNVFISDCCIDTGDDAICLKSGASENGEIGVNKNIVVTNCVLSTCCNGFKFGTGSAGGFENIAFSNSVIYNNAVDLAQRVISGIALEVVDGGWIDGVVVTGIRMQRTRTPIFIHIGDRSNKHPTPQHGLRGVMIQDIHASESVLASSITGLDHTCVEDVTLSNIRVDNILASPAEQWLNRPVPEVGDTYPEARMFGMLPASGLYCRHVRGLRLTDIAFQVAANEQRSVLICDDVRGLRVSGMTTTPTRGEQPVVKLVQSGDAWISGCAAPAGTKAFLAVEGADSASILLSGCDLRKAEQAIDTASDVSPSAIETSGNILKAN